MLRKFRNSLLNSIQAAKLDPRAFNPTEEKHEGYDAYRLYVGDSPLFFLLRTKFAGDDRQFNCWFSTYKRGHPQPAYSETQFKHWYTFPEIERTFKDWLNDHARKYLTDLVEEDEDQTLPDLWAELDLTSSPSDDSQKLQNTPFCTEERTRIAEALNEFEEEVKRREILSEEQINLLHERIEYLVESSKRLGRKDWLAAAAGALIGFTFQAGLTADTATQIIHLAGEALRWIGHTPLLLP